MEAVYIHGTTAQQITKAETLAGNRQRAALVKPPVFVDTTVLSGGEMLAVLMAERYRMLSEYYPEIQAYGQGFEMLRAALAAGLANTPAPGGNIGEVLAPAAATIRKARTMTAPASGFLSWADRERTPASGLGDPIITQLDCMALYPYVDQAQFPGQGWVETHNISQMDKRAKCNLENEYRAIFNQHLEKMSMWPLYDFLAYGEAMTAKVDSKRAGHITFVNKISSDSKISRGLIREWMTNGAMRANLNAGAGPLPPTEAIQALKQQAGVGALPLFVIPLIIGAIAAMAANTKIWIGVIKGKQNLFQGFKQAFTNTLDTVSNLDWGPKSPDWAELPNDPNNPATPGGNTPPGTTQAGFNFDTNTVAAITAALVGVNMLSTPTRK